MRSPSGRSPTSPGTGGLRQSDIILDCLTFPIATGQEETRRDGLETIEAIREVKRLFPDVQTTLGLSNISFGLNPAARVVLNSVFLNECIEAGLDSAIVHAAKIIPMARIPDEQREVALDMVYDRRRPATATEPGYDPLQRFLELFEGVTTADTKAERAAELLKLPTANGCSAASSTARPRASRMILTPHSPRASRNGDHQHRPAGRCV